MKTPATPGRNENYGNFSIYSPTISLQGSIFTYPDTYCTQYFSGIIIVIILVLQFSLGKRNKAALIKTKYYLYSHVINFKLQNIQPFSCFPRM